VTVLIYNPIESPYAHIPSIFLYSGAGHYPTQKISEIFIFGTFGGTLREHKVPWGILENRIATPAGISFLEMPCIILLVILGRFPLGVPTKNRLCFYGQ
jgi:hypothetical protein